MEGWRTVDLWWLCWIAWRAFCFRTLSLVCGLVRLTSSVGTTHVEKGLKRTDRNLEMKRKELTFLPPIFPTRHV